MFQIPLALCAALLLAGCATPNLLAVDAGLGRDGGLSLDGGAGDGGPTADAGATADGGGDGGLASDGGVAVDGGTAVDGGGSPDGGGMADGGSVADGGLPPDGGVGTCASPGACVPNDVGTESETCGACAHGTRSRTRSCLPGCTWGPWSGWSACATSGPCCGDGVASRSFDPSTGWYDEECDEGAANGSSTSACGSDCRYRSCAGGRICGPLRSTFGAWLPGATEQIAALFLEMKEAGYEEYIPVNIGAQKWRKSGSTFSVIGVEEGFIDTSAGKSRLQRLLDTAARAGIGVILGLAGLPVEGGYDWEVWMNASRRRPFVEYSLDLAARVIAQVGGSPAFRGLYLSQEMNLGDSGQCTAAGNFYAEMISGAHGRRGLRALLNDLGGTRLITVAPYLAVADQSAATVGSRLRCLYDKLQAAGGIDRMLVQDGVPKGEAGEGFTLLSNVASYFSAMHAALPAGGREALWVDLETYAWPDAPCTSAPGGSRPASIDRIGDQVREIGRFVGGFSQWVHAHNFRASGLGLDSCDPSRTALGNAYRSRPFPFHAFNYQSYAIVRGYRLEPGGTARLSCDTAAGRRTFDIREADGMGVSFAPSWVVDADVPDPREIVEVSLPRPTACTGSYSVTYISPAGVASSTIPF